MTLNYIKSQSSVSPEIVDTVSSKKVVYIRRNITEITKTDEESGEEYTYYEYEEAKLTKPEYNKYLKEFEVIAIMQHGVELEQAKETIAKLQEQIAVTEMTMIENYEAQEEINAATENALIELYESMEV